MHKLKYAFAVVHLLNSAEQLMLCSQNFRTKKTVESQTREEEKMTMCLGSIASR